MKILFSWIGHADLLGFAKEMPEYRERIIALTGKQTSEAMQGPVKTAVGAMKFDRAVLLWNYKDPELLRIFQNYCGNNVSILPVSIENPTDYRSVYCSAADTVLKNHTAGDDLFYLLSPGTPAMAAVWVLLGKTKFEGTFLQTYKNQVSVTEIPFDLSAELLPELLDKTDRLLESLPDVSAVSGFEEIVGQSIAIRSAVQRAAKAAMHNVPILITGESGTGKEMFARAVWKAGPRKNGPFEAINCAALPANLLEAELFGYKKGAFTGAVRDRDGAFKRLNGGTLFLDEVGECSPELQAKLLRVLQPPPGKPLSCREFYPVGADKPEFSDVRIITATNRDLSAMMTEQKFRDDLFFRLAAITVALPALRERKEDIPLLADQLLQRVNRDFKMETPEFRDKYFSANTKKLIMKYPWYGNVRELLNAVLQGVVMSSGEEILISDMGLIRQEESNGSIAEEDEIPLDFSLENELKKLEAKYIAIALKQSGNNKSRAAKLLGFSNYQRLDARIKTLKIQTEKE